jgi:hypothetical protein
MYKKSSDAEVLIATVTNALKEGDLIEADRNLKILFSQEPLSACMLNLSGILAEIRGERENARRYYLAAYIFDGSYAPALKNLDRVTSFVRNHGIDYGDTPEKREYEEAAYKIVYDEKHIGSVVKK